MDRWTNEQRNITNQSTNWMDRWIDRWINEGMNITNQSTNIINEQT